MSNNHKGPLDDGVPQGSRVVAYRTDGGSPKYADATIDKAIEDIESLKKDVVVLGRELDPENLARKIAPVLYKLLCANAIVDGASIHERVREERRDD